MHRIEKAPYGYRLVIEGFLGPSEADAMLAGLQALEQPRGGLLVDLRHSRTLHPDAQESLKLALLHCRQAGMARIAFVLDSVIALVQARCVVRDAGQEDAVKLLDASGEPDWERSALDWLGSGA